MQLCDCIKRLHLNDDEIITIQVLDHVNPIFSTAERLLYSDGHVRISMRDPVYCHDSAHKIREEYLALGLFFL